MRNILIITKYELIKYIRQPMVIIFAIIFPIFWVWLSGLLYHGNEASEFFSGYGTVDYMFPSYCLLIFLVTGITSIPINLAHGIESKTLVRLSFTSLRKYQYLFAIFLSNMVINTIAVLTMFGEARYLYNIQVPINTKLLLFIIYMFLAQLFTSSIGIIIVNIVYGFQNVLYVSLMTYFIIMFLSGATIPLQTFPKVLINISNKLPFTYFIKSMRYYWLGIKYSNLNTWNYLLLLFAFGAFILAIWSFNWGEKQSLKFRNKL